MLRISYLRILVNTFVTKSINTWAAPDMQTAIVTPVFDNVYQSIFDILQPIREKELKDIQLTENLNPKPKKKKKIQTSDEASQGSNENQNKES